MLFMAFLTWPRVTKRTFSKCIHQNLTISSRKENDLYFSSISYQSCNERVLCCFVIQLSVDCSLQTRLFGHVHCEISQRLIPDNYLCVQFNFRSLFFNGMVETWMHECKIIIIFPYSIRICLTVEQLFLLVKKKSIFC